ncbi:hypothetical protein E4T39_01158 [Aureobasidium subglaciale]|nr:hypothetical protein E4T39_01158 [Aureobasidium subglaciale]
MELLAHASAPSSRRDDERFKRQAMAYSSFQASNLTSEPDTGEVDYVGDAVLPLPVDSSLPSRVAHDALPPDESAVFKVPVARASTSKLLSSQPGSSILERGLFATTPSRRPQTNEHVTPSYLDGLSTVSPFEMPSHRTSLLRTSNLALRQDDFSSPSDDIPSQLPSTYSISDINSDPVHSDQPDAPPSSAWGSLPQGSAAQQWNGVIEEESPLKGLRSLGKFRVQRSSPLKQTQSLESPRANMSAHVRPLHSSAPTGHEDVSSASLDRAVAPRQRQQTEPPRATFSSSFELRFSSAPQAVETQPDVGDDEIPSSLDKRERPSQQPLRPSFDLRFSSAPQAQGTQLSDVGDYAVRPMLRRPSLSEVLPTSSDSRFSSSPEAQGTQPNSGNDTAVPQALRQHTLDQLLPTSFESRFSSSPDAHGTPFIEKGRHGVDTAETSSSPSTKINLFQPRLNLLAAKPRLSMSPAMQRDAPDLQDCTKSAADPTRSDAWQPSSSASGTSSAFSDRAESDTAIEVSTLHQNARVEERSLLSSRIPETAIAAKRRKFVSLSTPKTKPNTQEREMFKTLSTEIRPPPPPTSSKHFITHITPQLEAQFWNSAELQGKYKPFLTRLLRTSERGYWHLILGVGSVDGGFGACEKVKEGRGMR